MTDLRQAKIDKIADYIPLQTIDSGEETGDLLFLSWGSTYGVVKTAVIIAIKEGKKVSHVHLRYLNPLPKNLGEILTRFNKIIIPEMNDGQLIKIIRSEYLVPAIGFNKVKGLPFATEELTAKINSELEINSPA